MSTAPEGEHRKPTAFVATFNYIAEDEATDKDFQQIMAISFKTAVNSVLRLFGDRIEIVDPTVELPATEVEDRADV